MYLFIREFKSNIKSLILWVIVSSALMMMSLSMFPYFAEQGEYINELMRSFPEEMLKAIQANNINFSNPLDYFGYIYQYLLLAAGIMAMLLGVSIVSKEEGEKTIDFLYARPITRTSILTQKGIFLIVQFLLFCIGIGLAAILGLTFFTDKSFDVSIIGYIMIATFLTQLLFAGLGLLVSIFIVKPKQYMPVALGVVFVFYFISMIAGIRTDLEVLKYVSPFNMFHVGNIVSNAQIESYSVIISLVSTLVFVLATYLLYNKKDFSN